MKNLERISVILPSEHEIIKKLINSDNIYGQFNQVISPMDSIKPIESRAGWSKDRVEEYNEERILL